MKINWKTLLFEMMHKLNFKKPLNYSKEEYFYYYISKFEQRLRMRVE